MKNKILSVVSAALLSLVCMVSVSASEWTTDTSTATSSVIIDGNDITLSFENDTVARSASAEKECDFSDNEEINIAFNLSFSGTNSKINRRVYIRNSSSKATELINIPGTDFEVLGSVVKSGLSENTKYEVRIGINPSSKDLVVLLDDEKVFEGNMGTKWKVDSLSSAKIYIRNNTTAKIADVVSGMSIEGISIGDKPAAIKTSPADGSVFVDSVTIDELSVSFSGPVLNETQDSGNFTLTKDGETVEFTTEPAGFDKVIIKPVGGFLPNGAYELTVISICDFFGTVLAENVKSGFTTAIEGYEPPKLSISAEKNEIYDNQSVNINISAKSETGIKWIKLYKDGEEIEEFVGKTDVSYKFSDEKGEYTFYAVTSDTSGGEARSEEIKIKVLHNEAPTVVTSLTGGESYNPDDLALVDISAADLDGEVVKIEVFAGSKLVATIDGASGSVDLSTLSLGRSLITVYAYDDMDAVGKYEVSIVLSAEAKTRVYLETDFEGYTSTGDADPSGVPFFERKEAVKTSASTAYGEEHGTVLEISTEGETIDGKSASGLWSRFNTTGTKSAYSIEFDIYIENEHANPYLMLKHPSQSIVTAQVQFNKNGKGLSLHNTKGSELIKPIEYKRWYSVKYQVDMIKHTYSFWLDGELLADEFGTLAELTQIDTRFVFEFAGNPAATKVCLDNLKITYIEPVAQIVSVGYDDVKNASIVSPEAKKLTFEVNTSLASTSVNENSVKLYCGNEEMVYEAVSYDDSKKTVTVILSEPLRSDKSYTLELTKKVTDSSSVPLVNGAFAFFETGFKPFDIKSAELLKDDDVVYGSGVILNNTTSEMSCVIIINVFKGTQLVEAFAVEEKIAANKEKTFLTDDVPFDEGCTAEMYFWLSLASGDAVTEVIKL